MSSMSALHALRRRTATALMRGRGGGGLPYPGCDYKAASQKLPQAETDMLWDDGTQNVEPVMDIYAPDHITLGGAAAMFFSGVGVFYGVYKTCESLDKASTQPFADREYPDLEPLARVKGIDSPRDHAWEF